MDISTLCASKALRTEGINLSQEAFFQQFGFADDANYLLNLFEAAHAALDNPLAGGVQGFLKAANLGVINLGEADVVNAFVYNIEDFAEVLEQEIAKRQT